MRAALYARTSTNDGRQDPEVQLTELREYIARRGFEVAGEYVDRASGASTNGRAELKRLRADAKRRRVDIVVCWKFDRVARSVIDLVTFAAELEAVGCEFISLTEQIDTTSPGGRCARPSGPSAAGSRRASSATPRRRCLSAPPPSASTGSLATSCIWTPTGSPMASGRS